MDGEIHWGVDVRPSGQGSRYAPGASVGEPNALLPSGDALRERAGRFISGILQIEDPWPQVGVVDGVRRALRYGYAVRSDATVGEGALSDALKAAFESESLPLGWFDPLELEMTVSRGDGAGTTVDVTIPARTGLRIGGGRSNGRN